MAARSSSRRTLLGRLLVASEKKAYQAVNGPRCDRDHTAGGRSCPLLLVVLVLSARDKVGGDYDEDEKSESKRLIF